MCELKMKALIVDDEKLARSRLRRLLKPYDDILIVGEARNGKEALDLIQTYRPDVLFLDIKMPILTGFEMLGELEETPHIIFTTAYDQYALQAFDQNALDYLLKPISEKRLEQSIQKLRKMAQHGEHIPFNIERIIKLIKREESTIRRFSVRVGDQILIIPDQSILYFHAEDKYTFLSTEKERFIIPFTLKALEARLHPERFLRVHRSFIVNLEQINSIHRWFGGKLKLKMGNGKEIVVSQTYVDAFKQMIHL